MYRQYENPNELKEYLEDLKTAYLIMSAESENWVFYDGRWEALSDLLNEIADIVGLSVDVVYNRKSRALKHLKKFILEEMKNAEKS